MNLTQPLRVMIVDDDEMLRVAYSVFLSTRPDMLFVGEAANGEEAVARISDIQPDVILMDRKLPAMNGITATHLIIKRYPDVRVLLLSADFSEADQEKAYLAGVSACLQKNISSDDLASAILATQHA